MKPNLMKPFEITSTIIIYAENREEVMKLLKDDPNYALELAENITSIDEVEN